MQRDRTGAQELLDQIASTVSRTENLWLTSMVKKDNNLTIDGASASVNGVANFITALKRSGYFSNIEIKESKQDEKADRDANFHFRDFCTNHTSGRSGSGHDGEARQRSGSCATSGRSSAEGRVNETWLTHSAICPSSCSACWPWPSRSSSSSSESTCRSRRSRRNATKSTRPSGSARQLNQEVTQLQVYRQRYGELKSQMDALSKQLETLKTIVPEEKEEDEFIRLVQGAASASNVSIRRFTAKPVVAREYHYDMPFELQADGPYFNLLDFFSRLSRLVAHHQRRRHRFRRRSRPEKSEVPDPAGNVGNRSIYSNHFLHQAR